MTQSKSWKAIKAFSEERLSELKSFIENKVFSFPPRLNELPLESAVILSYSVGDPVEITLNKGKATEKTVKTSFVTFELDSDTMSTASLPLEKCPEVLEKDCYGLTFEHTSAWEAKIK